MIFSIDFGGIARTVPSIADANGPADRDGKRTPTDPDGQHDYAFIEHRAPGSCDADPGAHRRHHPA